MSSTTHYKKLNDMLESLPAENGNSNLRSKIKTSLDSLNHKLVVLDDDPTGVQTVHDIYVITDWDKKWIKEGLLDDRSVLYILTNTRSYSPEKAKNINEEIVTNLSEVAKELKISFSIISRSDSTLRGHYPLEIDVLNNELFEKMNFDISGHLIIPAFFEGKRYTLEDSHYLVENDYLVPVNETEFSKDTFFGFSTAYLPRYIEEKRNDSSVSKNILSITIDDIRTGGVEKVNKILEQANNNTPIIVNAASYSDLDIVSLAVLKAIENGKHFLFRTAASFVKSLGGIEDRPYLTASDMISKNTNLNHGGLIVVGSHTHKTTEQIKKLMSCYPFTSIEMNVSRLLDERSRKLEITRVIDLVERSILACEDTIVYTSREVIKAERKEDNLIISQNVSSSLVEIVQSLKIQPKFIMAKGGITSSDVATQGLGIKRAKILGQAIAGVPVWLTGNEARFKETPYIVFPGNVGENDSIVKVIEAIKNDPNGRG